MTVITSLLIALLAIPLHPVQDGYLSPQQQLTLLQYLGTDARPLVPTAIKRTSETDANYAANWLAGRRKQSLTTYSFDEKSAIYFLANGQTIETIFASAKENGTVLYFEDAEKLFGLNEPSPGQKQMAQQFAKLAKGNTVAVLVQCIREDSWYQLAKAGFGIVDLKLD